MRILWLNWYDPLHPRAGGAEVHLHQIAKGLIRSGHHVLVVSVAWRGAARRELVDGIEVRRFGRWWSGHISIPKAARELFQSETFDLVIDGVNKVPFEAPRWSPVPVIPLFLHLVGETAFRDFPDPIARWYLRRESRISKVYEQCEAVTISESTKRELVAQGLSENQIAVIEPPIDLERYRALTRQRASEGLRMLVISRLRRYKRIDLALRAAALLKPRHPELSVEVIGSGPALEELQALASELGLNVRFRGHVDEEAKIAALQAADVLLAPSEKEGFGLTCVEGMACGAKVVATRVPGHVDAVLAGAGLLVDADPASMAEGVARVCSDPSLTADAMNRAKRLGCEQIVRQFEAFLLRQLRDVAHSLLQQGSARD